ncbi:hypothetical protein RFI_19279 [Reticulomyxa filosa]|uniref:Uncharacterized protein n=1 Tax=Reticulomyxa filosa TaxID=46433 RepID=X6MWK1_RETFI|nr:hypothetical protein RFI_19279 [Reticulomyxa filosa]|eukprot:ETO18016.1 hypothetical protein RFI_19279 [Reticulomyxa filosa]
MCIFSCETSSTNQVYSLIGNEITNKPTNCDGLAPRTLWHLLQSVKKNLFFYFNYWTLQNVRVLQICDNKLADVLTPNVCKSKDSRLLKISDENTEKVTMVSNAKHVYVNTFDSIRVVCNRFHDAQKKNPYSYTILSVFIERCFLNANDEHATSSIHSVLHFVQCPFVFGAQQCQRNVNMSQQRKWILKSFDSILTKFEVDVPTKRLVNPFNDCFDDIQKALLFGSAVFNIFKNRQSHQLKAKNMVDLNFQENGHSKDLNTDGNELNNLKKLMQETSLFLSHPQLRPLFHKKEFQQIKKALRNVHIMTKLLQKIEKNMLIKSLSTQSNPSLQPRSLVAEGNTLPFSSSQKTSNLESSPILTDDNPQTDTVPKMSLTDSKTQRATFQRSVTPNKSSFPFSSTLVPDNNELNGFCWTADIPCQQTISSIYSTSKPNATNHQHNIQFQLIPTTAEINAEICCEMLPNGVDATLNRKEDKCYTRKQSNDIFVDAVSDKNKIKVHSFHLEDTLKAARREFEEMEWFL